MQNVPSYAEGFPMLMIEAWSFGAPTVITTVGGIADLAEHGVNSVFST